MQLDVKRAFSMTVAHRRWFEIILVGALIWIAASALSRIPTVGGIANMLVLSLASGYCLRVMHLETTAQPASLPTSLPEWDGWSDLLKDGLILTLINTIYSFVLGLVLFVLALLAGLTPSLAQVLTGDFGAAFGAGGGAALVVLLIMGVVVLLYAAYMPMMAAHFAHERRFAAGFAVGSILKRALLRPGELLLVFLVAIALAFAVVVSALTVVLAPFAVFASQVILADLFAQVYRLSGEAKPAA